MIRKFWIAASSAALLALSLPFAAQAASVTINVNGSAVSFDQQPIERGGRVYVPLRGVFERLGASVVYSRPNINATGNGHNVALTIGSRSATVDGNNVQLDSPPFLVGSRTLVPLRFVAQALGATVNYNGNTRVVDISGGSSVGANNGNNGNNGNTGNTGDTNGNTGAITLTNLNPNNGDVRSSNAPTLSGNFSDNVDANSVRILLDSRDITNSSSTYVGANSFQVTLPPITPGQHKVTVRGNSASGQAFSQSYSFRSGADTSKPFLSNIVINNVPATNGMQVPGSYTVSGSTTPNATVQILIASQNSLFGGLINLGANTNSQNAVADSAGHFTASVDSSAIGSPQQYVIGLRAFNNATKAASAPVQYTVHS
ncbi:MAG: copper amine oxidase N-terminal domain-containing protein [Candidatus Eremiobacteraeota bacterium]|nr:copper amine oxidase N-terminal domain-containing protein [Candidatus Eremiobacteraeota bacterium]